MGADPSLTRIEVKNAGVFTPIFDTKESDPMKSTGGETIGAIRSTDSADNAP